VRGAVVVALALFIARVSTAQAPSARPVAFEARLDGILASRVTTTHVGLGVARAATRNVELQVVVGGGITTRGGRDDASASARADILARFAPPPGDRNRWGGYAAGGVSALVERGTHGRAVLALLVGARGRRSFVEVGLGGGLRLGAGVRF
jgi:hypothetical protein